MKTDVLQYLGMGPLRLDLHEGPILPVIQDLCFFLLLLFFFFFFLLEYGIRSHHFMANRWGNNENSDRIYFGGSKITVDGDCTHEIKRPLLLGRKVMTNLDSKKQGQYFANKGPSSQSYGFSSSHV